MNLNVYMYICQIRMRSRCYSNTDADSIVPQFGMDTINKIVHLHFIVSHVYNNIMHNNFTFNRRKIHLTTLLVFFIR
jgi:hypothetical protein